MHAAQTIVAYPSTLPHLVLSQMFLIPSRLLSQVSASNWTVAQKTSFHFGGGELQVPPH